MVRFGVLSTTFWSIGVDLPTWSPGLFLRRFAGLAVSYDMGTISSTNIAQFVEKMPGALLRALAWKPNSSTKIGIPFAWGTNSSTKIGIPFAWGTNSMTNIAPGATLKTRFREGVFEPLENGPICGAYEYFLVHWRRPGRWGCF